MVLEKQRKLKRLYIQFFSLAAILHGTIFAALSESIKRLSKRIISPVKISGRGYARRGTCMKKEFGR